MAKDMKPASTINEYHERALWLRAAADALREDFNTAGLPLPDLIRFGFTTKGAKTQQTGETWHSPASADKAFEIYVRSDQDDPMEILTILVRCLVHAALPAEDSHGKKYKAAATKIGLVGKMRSATAGHLLEPRLRSLLEHLGPLPHASLDLNWSAFERKKRQTNRWLNATCMHMMEVDGNLVGCGYQIRLTAKWAKIGVRCPLHGDMIVEFPKDETEQELSSEAEIEASPENVPPHAEPDSNGHQHENYHHENVS